MTGGRWRESPTGAIWSPLTLMRTPAAALGSTEHVLKKKPLFCSFWQKEDIQAWTYAPFLYFLRFGPSSNFNILLRLRGRRDAFLARSRQRSTAPHPPCNAHTLQDLHLNCAALPFIFYVFFSLTQLCEGMFWIPFDSANSIWCKNKYTAGMGDKKYVGVAEGDGRGEWRDGWWLDERGWRWREVRVYKQRSGEKKRMSGSGAETSSSRLKS